MKKSEIWSKYKDKTIEIVTVCGYLGLTTLQSEAVELSYYGSRGNVAQASHGSPYNSLAILHGIRVKKQIRVLRSFSKNFSLSKDSLERFLQ